MKKLRITAFLLSAVLALPLLTSCHGSRKLDPFVMPEAFDTEKQYEITFLAKSDTNVAQTNIYKKTIADFEALYPNIKVKLDIYTDYGKIYNYVITNIATQTTPNVCITYPDHIATYLTSPDTVVCLDDLFFDERYGLGGSELRYDGPSYDELIPKFLEECEIDGKHYAMPYMRSTEACYINKTFVEKLGYTVPDVLTWDFVFEVSNAAMAKDEEGNFLINGQKTLIPFIYKSTDNMMIQMLKQKGAGYSNDDGEILIFNDTTIDLLRMLEEPAKLRSFSTFSISSYPANFLNAGQCIFAVDSTAGATWMGTDAPLSDIDEDVKVRFETAVRPIPQFNTEDPTMISQGPSVCVFNKRDPGEVLASWLFAQYLLVNDVQISYSQTEGYVPVTSKAQNSEEYKTYLANEGIDNKQHYAVKLQATKLLIENTDRTFVTPVFNGSASLRNAAGQMIENVTKSMRRGVEVNDEYYEKLFADVTALYRLDSATSMGEEKAELGKLPSTAVFLLSAIGAVWILIAISALVGFLKKRKKKASAS
ncbi:MAG: extracellular solute-binding protein [Clostridia bacterium]|nr:extracellular solute-binding protein [Clostridia bacterium]